MFKFAHLFFLRKAHLRSSANGRSEQLRAVLRLKRCIVVFIRIESVSLPVLLATLGLLRFHILRRPAGLIEKRLNFEHQ